MIASMNTSFKHGRPAGRWAMTGMAAMVAATVLSSGVAAEMPGAPKSAIFMIPDGCDQAVVTAARWFKGADLALDAMSAGVVKTHMANSIITGSGAAATAFACGEKTTARFLGVGPRTNDLLTIYQPGDPEKAYAPLASILELAKKKGKSIGLISTSRITHATPASFGSHIHDRGLDNDIMEHLVYNNIDVLMGGGRRHLLPTSMGGKRTDGENLEQELLDRGYTIVSNQTELAALVAAPGMKVAGMFAMSHMDADIDRAHANPDEPSIAEMTAKAIEILSQNPNGFFLMVEGSQVDWAGHNNDPIWMITDMLAFDEALQVAKDFCDSDGQTLLAAFPDHNTGGMKIGHYDSDAREKYTATKISHLLEPLAGMQVTANTVADEITAAGGSDADIVAKLDEWWGITATQDDVDEINALKGTVGLSYALARTISKNHTVIGWTTHGHNAEEVPVWLHGSIAGIGIGTIDNVDLANAMADMWGESLADLTDALYVNVDDAFPGEWMIDWSDPQNGVLVIKSAVEMPFSKDIAIYLGTEHPTGSLTVYAPVRDMSGTVVEDKVYISQSTIDAINSVLP